jgi:uncharacterized protein YegJ (DUF2314 family)
LTADALTFDDKSILNLKLGFCICFRMDDGSQRMYYTGQGSDGSTAIGVAKQDMRSSDKWVREQATIVFAVS